MTGAMSAIGTKRTFEYRRTMSAFGVIASAPQTMSAFDP